MTIDTPDKKTISANNKTIEELLIESDRRKSATFGTPIITITPGYYSYDWMCHNCLKMNYSEILKGRLVNADPLLCHNCECERNVRSCK